MIAPIRPAFVSASFRSFFAVASISRSSRVSAGAEPGLVGSAPGGLSSSSTPVAGSSCSASPASSGTGSFGSWSFQASKNLSAGEGGALTTDDAALAEAAWELHNCGRRRDEPWYAHFEPGGNHRLTEWSAAVLAAGLRRLPAQIERRTACAAVLDTELSTVDGIRPLGRDARADVHAHHLYLFRYDPAAFAGLDREWFVAALRHHGIPAATGYPAPLDRQPLFAQARFDRRATGWTPANPATRYGALPLPVCERACAETVWLPHSLLLAEPAEMADVVTAIREVQHSAVAS